MVSTTGALGRGKTLRAYNITFSETAKNCSKFGTHRNRSKIGKKNNKL
jgi:hypothetical protein